MPNLWNTAQGLSHGTTPTTGNTGGSSGDAFDGVNFAGSGSIVADNTHSLGGMAYKFVGDTSNNIIVSWITSLAPSAIGEVWGMAAMYLTANPTTAMRAIWVRNVGSQVAAVRINTNGKVELHNAAASVIATSTASVNLNGWFYLRFHVKALATNGVVEVELYNDINSNTPTETLSVTNATLINNLDRVSFGRVAASNPNTFWMDFLNVNTTAMPELPYAVVDVADIRVLAGGVDLSLVDVAEISLVGTYGDLARVDVTGVWVTGRRPQGETEPASIWMASGGYYVPLKIFKATGGSLQ